MKLIGGRRTLRPPPPPPRFMMSSIEFWRVREKGDEYGLKGLSFLSCVLQFWSRSLVCEILSRDFLSFLHKAARFPR
jgi:hypothetical protein